MNEKLNASLHSQHRPRFTVQQRRDMATFFLAFLFGLLVFGVVLFIV